MIFFSKVMGVLKIREILLCTDWLLLTLYYFSATNILCRYRAVVSYKKFSFILNNVLHFKQCSFKLVGHCYLASVNHHAFSFTKCGVTCLHLRLFCHSYVYKIVRKSKWRIWTKMLGAYLFWMLVTPISIYCYFYLLLRDQLPKCVRIFFEWQKHMSQNFLC
jgi:hypothetical protein